MLGKDNKTGLVERAFALPVVMIASVVMMMVLVSGLSATTSVNSGLRQQHTTKLLSGAVDSGMAMANDCMKANSGQVTWSAANPLRPNTNCDGTESGSCSTPPTTAACTVTNSPTIKTTFSVSYDVSVRKVTVTGRLYNVRASDNSSILSQDQSVKYLDVKQSSGVPNGDAIAASQIPGSDGGDGVAVAMYGSGSERRTCGVQASNGVVTCTSTSAFDPFGTTPMYRAIEGNYSYCAITTANTAVCTEDTSNSPFGTTQIKNITASSTDTQRVCGIRLSDNNVQCASLGGNPFGSVPMKDIIVSSDSTSYACAIQKSNDQVTCANVIAAPFGTTAMKKIELTMAPSTNSRYVCGVRSDNDTVTCVVPSASPFGSTQMLDVAVAVSGTTNGNYVCGLAASSLAVSCTSIASSPFGSTAMADISVATDSGAKSCSIAQSNGAVSCTDTTSSPFGSTQLGAASSGSAGPFKPIWY